MTTAEKTPRPASKRLSPWEVLPSKQNSGRTKFRFKSERDGKDPSANRQIYP